MPSKSDFSFVSALGTQPGQRAEGVVSVQDYLACYGYLPARETEYHAVVACDGPQCAPGVVDDHTQSALRRYQRFHGLPITGVPDEAAIAEMSKPRCGFPDTLSLSDYQLQGNKWPHTNLSYNFLNTTSDLPQQQVISALRRAFDLWAMVSPLRFSTSSNPDIKILFAPGQHGDSSPFDGPGRVLAHAYFPPPNAGDLAGDAHFDEAETWADSLPPPAGRFDLMTVAAHEFGHSLGLRHSQVRGALMYPSYDGPHRYLHQDDINGIRALYGARQTEGGTKACGASGPTTPDPRSTTYVL